MSSKRRVCIIGAGTAGLCALKNALEQGMEAIAYEQSDEVGGTWVYSENVSNVSYEDEVHSSMYEGLYTNLPKEVMGYPDFLYPNHLEESFVRSSEVLKFLQSYTEHFNLKAHIKFLHSVIRVRPWKNAWEVYVCDKQTDNCEMVYFDFVFVCNGHYTTPQYPDIEGMNIYRGKTMHSHLYRKADMLKDETVLVIGGGPSGVDITHHIHKSAKRVFLSHHLKTAPATGFMANVTQKPDIERFTEDGAIFTDGTSETFAFVIFCTGYKYTFPFLSVDCGVHVDNNCVEPLYKHIININYPTMAFIGLPFLVLPTQCFDLQVRFALTLFKNKKKLPSRENMMADMEQDMQERFKSGLKKYKAHQMGDKQYDYYKDLAEIAGTDNIKEALQKIMKDCQRKYIFELATYRNNCFRIIDDENFVKYTLSKP